MVDIKEGRWDGKDKKIVIIVSKFNEEITSKLSEGALNCLLNQGVKETQIQVIKVPGAFELPQMANHVAQNQSVDGILCLGAVIRGETSHYELICTESARGIQDVALKHDIPVIFGVLTTETIAQAEDRLGGAHGHKGEDTALALLEMMDLFYNRT